MQLSDDFHSKWEHLINEADKDQIPLECVKKAVFRFVDGGQKTINLRQFRKQGLVAEEIESVIDRFMQENGDRVRSMEFVLDVEAVAETIQPHTDELLKGM